MNTTHTLNEILNGDKVALSQLLEEHAAVNILGRRGDGPIHIAVYRRDMEMLQMLLDAHADIKFQNVMGNTATHIAAFLGLPDFVKKLYDSSSANERFQLLLEIRNKAGETACDLANKAVEDHDLDSYRLYAVSDDVPINTLDSVRQPMVDGRRECASFLESQMQQDRLNKVHGSISTLIDCNIARRKTNNILRGGIAGTDAERVYSAALDYPKALDDPSWDRKDIQFFLNYETSVREVMLGAHSRDLAQRVVATSSQQAFLKLRIDHLEEQGRSIEAERWTAPPESIGLQWT